MEKKSLLESENARGQVDTESFDVVDLVSGSKLNIPAASLPTLDSVNHMVVLDSTASSRGILLPKFFKVNDKNIFSSRAWTLALRFLCLSFNSNSVLLSLKDCLSNESSDINYVVEINSDGRLLNWNNQSVIVNLQSGKIYSLVLSFYNDMTYIYLDKKEIIRSAVSLMVFLLIFVMYIGSRNLKRLFFLVLLGDYLMSVFGKHF